MTNLREQIGKNIREERISHGISMDELSEMLDISPAFVGLIERGQRGASVKNLMKISKIFSVSIDSLTNNHPSREDNFEDFEPKNKKLNTIQSLIYDLNDDELDFVMHAIDNLKNLHRYIS